MTRDEQMQMVLDQIRPILKEVNAGKEDSWYMAYGRAASPWLEATTTEWERKYHQIVRNDEYFWIWNTDTGDQPWELLYAVNVTGDSLVTAASELMNLLARKF